MNVLKIIGIGYLFGCVSPAAIIGKIKKINLKQTGTKNLGATNASLVLGPGAGLIVLIVDILKSITSAKVSMALFPQISCAGMIACIGCILGHCFPLFLHFRGGKGVAVFAGMILCYEPWFVVPILAMGIALIVLLNTGVAAPMLACVMFPLLVAWKNPDATDIALAVVASLLIVITHRDNIKRALSNNDVISVREYWKKLIKKHRRNRNGTIF